MSYLQSKSSDLVKAANLLHSEELFPAVAHSAYYCCLQLMRHILLHSLHMTEEELKQERTEYNERVRKEKKGKKELGTHEFLIKKVGKYIKNCHSHSAYGDFKVLNTYIWELKELRTIADYSDEPFNSVESIKSLRLSRKIMMVLKNY
jgi:hypothetical protein